NSAVEGSDRSTGLVYCRIFFHSCPPKKKSLLFSTGPPRCHPKSLNRKLGFTGEKKLRASKASLRMNSNAPPCNWLPPLLVITFTDAPDWRPYSAEKLDVCVRTS